MSELFLGIDLGGTNVKVGCFDSKLKMLCKISAATNAEKGPDVVIDTICDTAKKLLANNKLLLDDVGAVGIGTPGPADLTEGIVISAMNLPGFRNIPLKKIVSERLGKPVVFENDANAACWGEHVAGAGKGADDMVFLTLGTGIGGGIICSGELVHGFGDNAAELGHLIIQRGGRSCACGQQGCVETYASALSTVKRATEVINAGAKSSLKKVLDENGEISCKDVFEHCAAGDKVAERIVESAAEALGILCVNLFHVTGPQRIVFAGGMTAAGDMLLKRIQHYFSEYIWPLKEEPLEICFATLGEDTGIIGTAALALRSLQQEKS